MTNKEFVRRYIDASKKQNEQNNRIDSALEVFSDGYFVFTPVVYELGSLIDELIIEKIGQSNYDWVMWWLYDSGPNKWCTINNIRYDLNDVNDFIERCIK